MRLWGWGDFISILLLCEGGWWWLRCLLHHCGRESDQLPHLQQTLQSRICKFSSETQTYFLFVVITETLNVFFLYSRTPTVLAPTSNAPCWTYWTFLSWTRKPSDCSLQGLTKHRVCVKMYVLLVRLYRIKWWVGGLFFKLISFAEVEMKSTYVQGPRVRCMYRQCQTVSRYWCSSVQTSGLYRQCLSEPLMYKKGHKNEDYSICSLLLVQPENFKLNDCSVASSHILSSRSQRWCNIF